MPVLTGFAQMPIFKRYYIADITGMGWLAQFYVTHFMPYLFAVFFIGYAAFRITDHFLSGKRWRLPTTIAYLRFAILSGLVITGVILVIRNLSGIYLPPPFIIFMDLAHLSLVMGFLVTLLIGLFLKRN